MNAPLKNPYCRRARIPRPMFRELLRQFAADEKAVLAAPKVGVSEKTATQLFHRLRRRLAEEREKISPFKPVHLDPLERRVRGRRLQPGEVCPRLVGVRMAHHQLCTEWVAAEHVSGVFKALYTRHFDYAQSLGYEGVIDLDTHRLIRLPQVTNGIPRDPLADQSLERLRARLIAREKAFYGWGKRHLYLWIKETEWRFAWQGRDPETELLKLLSASPL